MVRILLLITSSFIFFPRLSATVPSLPVTTGTADTSIFPNFFSSRDISLFIHFLSYPFCGLSRPEIGHPPSSLLSFSSVLLFFFITLSVFFNIERRHLYYLLYTTLTFSFFFLFFFIFPSPPRYFIL